MLLLGGVKSCNGCPGMTFAAWSSRWVHLSRQTIASAPSGDQEACRPTSGGSPTRSAREPDGSVWQHAAGSGTRRRADWRCTPSPAASTAHWRSSTRARRRWPSLNCGRSPSSCWQPIWRRRQPTRCSGSCAPSLAPGCRSRSVGGAPPRARRGGRRAARRRRVPGQATGDRPRDSPAAPAVHAQQRAQPRGRDPRQHRHAADQPRARGARPARGGGSGRWRFAHALCITRKTAAATSSTSSAKMRVHTEAQAVAFALRDDTLGRA